MLGALDILTKEGRPYHKFADMLPETVNMYMMGKIFPWCSPDVYRRMSDWDKMVYLSIISGEGDARKQESKNSEKTTSKHMR